MHESGEFQAAEASDSISSANISESASGCRPDALGLVDRVADLALKPCGVSCASIASSYRRASCRQPELLGDPRLGPTGQVSLHHQAPGMDGGAGVAVRVEGLLRLK